MRHARVRRCLFTHSNTTHVCFFSIPFPETASPHQPLIDHLLPPQPRASADFHCVIPSSPWAHSLPSEPPRPPGCDAALPSRALWCHGLSQMQLASAACFVSARAASSLRQAMMHCLSCASQMQHLKCSFLSSFGWFWGQFPFAFNVLYLFCSSAS